MDKPLPPPVPPSSPVFWKSRIRIAVSFNIISQRSCDNYKPTAATPRVAPGEGGQKLRSAPPSSLPVPIPRTISKGEKRVTASLPPSARPVPASAPVFSSPIPPPGGCPCQHHLQLMTLHFLVLRSLQTHQRHTWSLLVLTIPREGAGSSISFCSPVNPVTRYHLNCFVTPRHVPT
ncbi:hypothetical protein BGY98DRAFT_365533 [Russula aff. rugulosa BPL654]|nr:hypothetical protein BGY98DRAFT_365533 [Russula aff. rugulosa BPL654]